MYIPTSSLKGKSVASWETNWPTGSLGQPATAGNKFANCTAAQQNAIQAAFLNAQRAVDNAAAVLGTVYARPDRITTKTRSLLNRHFHTVDRGNILKILRNLFRIGQALQKGLNFECTGYCGGPHTGWCGYARATQWFGGHGKVHICFDDRPATCTFMKLKAPEQAALIIHEAAHRHVGIDDKAYAWETSTNSSRDYSKLTSKQALNNADSYAWFSVMGFPGKIK